MPNRMLKAEQTLLLVVDIQEKFRDVIHGMDRVIRSTKILIEAFKALGLPIVVSEQYPKGLGRTVKELLEVLPEGAKVLEKTAFGCLGDEALFKTFQALGKRQVLVAGIEAHVCVNQTVHGLLDAGYEPHIVREAVSSRDPETARLALEKMTGSGAVQSTVELALFELMRDAKHPAFKAVQALVK
ncbi:MAG: isochorismatase family protein [Elusimicrobia bacterium]|nr:isochorismatase family protein [Elusimicrobiota bacterium]